MVRVCSFPGCYNREKRMRCRARSSSRDTSVTFHRLPLHDPERLRLWLIVLRLDLTTSAGTLRAVRVCSEHFTPEDYRPKMHGRKTELLLLKRTAVPTASVRRTELEDTWAVKDRPPSQVRSTDIEVDEPKTSTATMEKPTLQYIVDEEAILQLMKNCPMCNRKCRCSKHTRGAYFIVYQSCYFCHYQRKWASQPEARSINIYKGHTPAKKKLQPKDRVFGNAKVKS